MSGYYRFTTRVGQFRIVPSAGRWEAMFQDEKLGNYATAQLALGDLAGGHCDWPSCGDPSQFGLPDDLSDWRFVRSS